MPSFTGTKLSPCAPDRREGFGPCHTTSLQTFLGAACRRGTHLPDLEREVRVLEDPLAQQDQREGGAAGRCDVLQTPNAEGGDAELLLHHLLQDQPLQASSSDALHALLRRASVTKVHCWQGARWRWPRAPARWSRAGCARCSRSPAPPPPPAERLARKNK